MTVNTTTITSGPYSGDDITSTFSYTFRVEDKTQLKVFETDDAGVETTLTVDTHYTVANIGEDAGGILTRVSGALPTDYTWFVRADYKLTQGTSLSSQGSFSPDIHEAAFDKLTFLAQQQQDEIDRSLTLSESYSGGASTAVPDPISGHYIHWNVAADALESRELPEDIFDAAASAAAAAVSETNAGVSETNAAASAVDAADSAASVDITNANIQAGIPTYYADTGAVNAIVITPSPSLASYAEGQEVTVKVIATTTAATTIKYGALATRAVILADGSALSGGEMLIGGMYNFRDNGTALILTNPESTGSIIKAQWPVMSMGVDTDHDITFSSGKKYSSDGTKILNLASGLTKQLDVTYADGDNAGGLFSGSIAVDTTYHWFLIQKDSDSTIHVGADTSLTAANIPSGYTSFRRICSVLTDASANIIEVSKEGDYYYFVNGSLVDLSDTTPATVATDITLSVPGDIKCQAIIAAHLNSAGTTHLHFGNKSQTLGAPVASDHMMRTSLNVSQMSNILFQMVVDESSMIQYRSDDASVSAFIVMTSGYIDDGEN